MSEAARFLSEEDLRTRVLIPYLQSIGVAPHLVRVEQTLTLRLGRTKLTVNGSVADSVHGRLDMLVLNSDNRPLFVVELKREDHALTDDDRDQGISYARLLPEMAPFVLLTNGRDSRLFDTITREPLQEENVASRWGDWQRAEPLATTEGVRLRFEALKFFLGYSSENVARFCRAQQEDSMRGLRGPDRKYIPQLYVMRDSSPVALAGFLASASSTFVLSGDSGVGKTCEMCAIAEALAQEHLVLFWNGINLYGDLAQRIADDFNWHFSEELSLATIVDRLAELSAASGRQVVFVIDAIDEAALSNAPHQLSVLARRLRETDGRVKLICSLKTAEWPRFALIRGNRAPILEHLFRGGTAAPPAPTSVTSWVEAPSAVLDRFNTPERDRALERYGTVFAVARQFGHDVQELARDPLMLRLACETFAARPDMPADAGDAELLRRYIEDRTSRSANPAVTRRAVIATAQALLPHTPTVPSPEPVAPADVSEEAIRAIDAGVAAAGLRDAAAFGVLMVAEDGLGRARFAFTYDRVRDFIVATEVLRLDGLSAADLRHRIRTLWQTAVGRAAVGWYMPSASEEHWGVMRQLASEAMDEFRSCYSSLRLALGPVLRGCVDPGGTTSVGAVFSINRYGRWQAGLFGTQDGEKTVVIEDGWLPRWLDSRGDLRRFPLPVYKAWTGSNFDILLEPRQRAAAYMLKEVTAAVDKGGLDDQASEGLMTERIFAIVDDNRAALGLPRRLNHGGVAARMVPADLLPLDIRQLRARINERFGEEYFKEQFYRSERDKQVAALRKRGQVPQVLTISLDHDVLSGLRARGVMEARRGRQFPKPPNRGDPLRLLLETLDTLRLHRGYLQRYHLPLPDVDSHDDVFESGYSDPRLRDFLECFFEAALTAYKAVVRASLGPLAPALELYGTAQPIALVEYVRPSQPPDEWDPHGELTYSYLDAGRRTKAVADVRLVTTAGLFRQRLAAMARGEPMDRPVQTQFGPLEVKVTHFTTFRSIVRPRRERPLGYWTHNRPPHGMWIREWVYDLVERDLKTADANRLLELLEVSHQERARPASRAWRWLRVAAHRLFH